MLTRAVDLKSAAIQDQDISAPFNELIEWDRLVVAG